MPEQIIPPRSFPFFPTIQEFLILDGGIFADGLALFTAFNLLSEYTEGKDHASPALRIASDTGYSAIHRLAFPARAALHRC